MGIKIDISKKDYKTLDALFQRHLPNTTIWAFGSRVKFTAKPNSDLDLVAFVDDDQIAQFNRLKEALEESDLPFSVDLHNWEELPEAFHQNIKEQYVAIQEEKKSDLPDGWKTYKLKNISLKIGSGATPRGGKEAYLDNGEYSLIRSQNVHDFKFSKTGLAFINEEQANKLKNVTVEENDVLLNITGDSVARVCQVPSDVVPARVNQHVAIIRTNADILDQTYLKYYLLQPNIKSYLLALSSTGATRKALTKSMIEGLELKLPSIVTQRQIAAILSTLDDKIELNLQMNETLEKMAQAIFKEWFVDFNFPKLSESGLTGFKDEQDKTKKSSKFSNPENQDADKGDGLPKGWKWGTIGDLSNNIRDSWKPVQGSDSLKYVGLEHIPRKSIMISEWGKSSDINSQKSQFKTGDILFGKLRPYFHKVITAPFDGICSTDILVIRSKELFIQLYLYFHLYSDNCIKYSNSHSSGTRMPRVNWKSLSNYEIPLPPKDILESFQKVLTPIFNKVHKSIYTNEYLINIRNTLLPKLMSGQISLKHLSESGLTG